MKVLNWPPSDKMPVKLMGPGGDGPGAAGVWARVWQKRAKGRRRRRRAAEAMAERVVIIDIGVKERRR